MVVYSSFKTGSQIKTCHKQQAYALLFLEMSFLPLVTSFESILSLQHAIKTMLNLNRLSQSDSSGHNGRICRFFGTSPPK